MKSRLVNVTAMTLFLSLLLFQAIGQTPPQKDKKSTQPQTSNKTNKGGQQKPGEEIQIGVREIMLPVTVTDDKDRPILELVRDDFEVMEDGVPQQIKGFDPAVGRPLDIAILMDISNSVRPKLKYEREAASNFIQTVLRNRRDRALFTTFSDQVELRQDFTDNSELLHKAISDKTMKAGGETKLYDAVYRLCEEKLDNTQGLNEQRRGVIIVITDGEDTASVHSLQEAINLAQFKGIPIYGISTKAGGFFGSSGGTVMNAEDKELRRLAQESGGDLFFPGDALALERVLREIEVGLRNQYLITYEPSNQLSDGKFRKIQVKLIRAHNREFKNFVIKTRLGYRAYPAGSTSLN